MKSVAGKTVLVTGAAMGMGRLFVERAIAERARRVILWDVDEAALAATVAELEAGDHETRLTAYAIDVTDDSGRKVAVFQGMVFRKGDAINWTG